MPPHRRVSIGYPTTNDTDNEWHQKIRDILDVGQPTIAVKSNAKKKGPIRRRTVCCDVSPVAALPSLMKNASINDRDESTASLSMNSNSKQPGLCMSSCDISPVSPERPAFYEGWKDCDLTSGPNKAGSDQVLERFLLAKHRINSPRRGSTGSPCTSSLNSSSPKSPFAEVKSHYHLSAFSKSQNDVNEGGDDDLPEVPFSPKLDHGSFTGSSSEDDIEGEDTSSDDNCTPQVSIQTIRRLKSNCVDKSYHKTTTKTKCSRRSSCGDPPSSPAAERSMYYTSSRACKYSRLVPRRASYHVADAHSPYSDTTDDNVLESPFHSTPKTMTPKFAIKMQRRSSCGESLNVPLPFATDASRAPNRRSSEMGAEPRRSSDAPEFLREASQSLLHHQHRRVSDVNVRCDATMDKMSRRVSNNDMPKKNTMRRRASDCGVPTYNVPLNDMRVNPESYMMKSTRAVHPLARDNPECKSDEDRPPISVLFCKTTKKSKQTKPRDGENAKSKQDPPACKDKRSSPFAFF